MDKILRGLVLVGYSNMARARRLGIHGPIGSGNASGRVEGVGRKEPEEENEKGDTGNWNRSGNFGRTEPVTPLARQGEPLEMEM